MKTALISGITGQDGSYLTELLLEKGYIVHGIIRRSSSFNTGRIDHLYNNPDILNKRLFLHYGDVTDTSNLNRLLEKTAPDEIYNLAAQSHVKVSFDVPEYTTEVDAIGTLRFLDAIKETEIKTKFYQASTSELYGKVQETPQSENTPFYPRSPYGVSKIYGYWIVVNYREAYNLYACNGILFNHESPRRGETFVTRKITRAASKIALNFQKSLTLGNLDAKRDWGYAPEYCEGMWRMLQCKVPEDFVLATGETHTVREFTTRAFEYLGIHLEWKGKGIDEKGVVAGLDKDKMESVINDCRDKIDYINEEILYKNLVKGAVLVEVDTNYFRPTEVDMLIGNAAKAKEKLGWSAKTKFTDLVDIMISSDFKKVIKKGY